MLYVLFEFYTYFISMSTKYNATGSTTHVLAKIKLMVNNKRTKPTLRAAWRIIKPMKRNN